MQIYMAGSIVRDMMTQSLKEPTTQVIFRSFAREVQNLKKRESFFDDGQILDAVELILNMPAGLAHSNFVDADLRKIFRRAVVAASKIRGMLHWGLVIEWEPFVEACEELASYLPKLEIKDA